MISLNSLRDRLPDYGTGRWLVGRGDVTSFLIGGFWLTGHVIKFCNSKIGHICEIRLSDLCADSALKCPHLLLLTLTLHFNLSFIHYTSTTWTMVLARTSIHNVFWKQKILKFFCKWTNKIQSSTLQPLKTYRLNLPDLQGNSPQIHECCNNNKNNNNI